MRVAVLGGAGYAGGELLRLLMSHPEVTDLVASSRSRAGDPIADTHPQLSLLSDARFVAHDPAGLASRRDVVFLALEHGESSRIMAEVIDAGPGMIVDLAADFRIRDGRLHERYYGQHPAPELVHRFSYGLADVVGTALHGSTAIAAPGCFATTAALVLYSVAELDVATPPVIFAVTGSSGAGQSPRPTTHHPARANDLFAYGVLNHRHQAEVIERWREWRGTDAGIPRLMPHAGSFVRGIHATLHARLDTPVDDLNRLIRKRFVGRPFVKVLDRPPHLADAVGSNLAVLHAATSDDGREVQLMCVLDNLIKGAGGQAIQAMNLALGIDERAGLSAPGPTPC